MTFWQDVGDSFNRASDHDITPLLKEKAKVSDCQIIETAAAAFFQVSPDALQYLDMLPSKSWKEILTHISEWHSSAVVIKYEKIFQVNKETPEEIHLITGYVQKIAELFPSAWSVDFAYTKDGEWYLIDTAEAYKSWHLEDCEHLTKFPDFYEVMNG